MNRIVVSFVLFCSLISSVFSAPWDFLRGPVSLIGSFSLVLAWVLLFVSMAMLGISILAYKKKRSHATLFVGIGFGLFFSKAVLIVMDFYLSSGNFFNYAIQSFFDLAIIVSLFIALFRKN
ncbi:MAG: hypothetical protein ACOX1V_04440 [Candidatus Iainarchaeum sp.]|nr:MAG: hypothetical protein BWY55_00441 [archaeon ADurb.Bin336]